MKGHHADKIRITFKRAGDGFMCDALCDDGFTYSIYFRNEPPPPKYTAMGLSPLHGRVMWLFDQLKDHGHRCRVDNLYMSCRFAKFCYNHENKILLEGVARKGRGIPQIVVQEEVKAPLKPQPEALSRQLCWKGTLTAPILWLSVSMTPSQSTSSPWSLSALSGLPSLERCGMQLFRLWFLWNF
jgi:hypothetical protein